MTKRRTRSVTPIALCICLALAGLPHETAAQETETMRFTASVLGLTAGRMTLGVNRKGIHTR